MSREESIRRKDGTPLEFDYKDPQRLRQYITDGGKIIPRRVSGLTAKEQRELTTAIKRARNLALIPYTAQ